MAKIEIVTNNTPDGVKYELKNGKNVVTVMCNDDCSLIVKGPRKLMEKAIGGRGEETETESTFTDSQCDSKSEAVSNVIEIFRTLIEQK